MRKTLLTFVLGLSLSSLAFGQQNNIDERLKAKFTESEINSMTNDELAFNIYCIEHAFIIMDFPKEKEGDAAINGARNITNLENINFFELNIELLEDQYQYFKILGTDKMLAIKPISLINKER
ncbi:MAG: hypothetical protein H6598_01050 [Flavobacteriales bacterium]|nr:hypothetical protein [Flavobacteriales bacterium]